MTPEARFWRFVDTSGGLDACWPWLGARNPGGYGHFKVAGRNVGAHRFALELRLRRPVGEGMHARHACDNPPCVNPSHLDAGAPAENVADRALRHRDARGAGHGRHTHPESTARGERVGSAKLTEASVRLIRQALASGVSQRAIALEHGVDRRSIQFIARGQTWAHVS